MISGGNTWSLTKDEEGSLASLDRLMEEEEKRLKNDTSYKKDPVEEYLDELKEPDDP